ncbi:hypothetical protein SAMN00017405_2293 [Desulfonispora thiosulfatigenes DSM 11270]|uniref:Uncharacterized protein n=1 Tax=Desulfonispora thiosulfatigenes DSM 11270 TaxID=656914 RepID=A0A1W1VDK6_DESTI|nr:hypothetical protein [Desulfonispora thiosulfatigenes]SMB91405.1 hypothetical protein SAMN00017405_2293 [Desulfonispora thiosulfatigenes DSM 11270]
MNQPELPNSIEDVKNMLKGIEAFLPEEYKNVINEAIAGIENGDGNPEESKQKLQQLLLNLMSGQK